MPQLVKSRTDRVPTHSSKLQRSLKIAVAMIAPGSEAQRVTIESKKPPVRAAFEPANESIYR